MMYYSVDRIEGNTAVLEDDNGKRRSIELHLLPENTEESDVLLEDENGIFVKDDEEKERRQKLILEMLENL